MARELLFQTDCGASGDMILAALVDLLAAGDEFKKNFENSDLDVKVAVADVEKNRLRGDPDRLWPPGRYRPPRPAKEAMRMVRGVIHESHGRGQD